MSSFSSDSSLRGLSFVGVFAFVVGRVWHEAFSLQGGIPMFNFLFYGFSILVLAHIAFRGLTDPLGVRRRLSIFFLGLAIFVSSLVVWTFYVTGDFNAINRDDFGAMYFGFVVSAMSYGVLGYLAFVFSRSFSVKAVLSVLLLSLVPILWITDWVSLAIVYRDYGTGRTVNYLLIGDIVVFAYLLYLLSVGFDGSLKFGNYLIGVLVFVVLFLNNSRSSLILFGVCFFVAHLIVALMSKEVRRKSIVLSLVGFSGFSLFAVFYWNDLEALFRGSRMLSLFLDAGADGSLQSRSLIMDEGLRRIAQNFLLGDIAGQIKHAYGIAPLGSYIHNVLSFWEQFGLVVFLLYIGAWGFLLLEVSRVLRINRAAGLILLFGFLFALFSMVFARAFVHTVFSAFLVLIACQASRLDADEELINPD